MDQGEGSSQKSPVGSHSSSFFDTSHQISQPLYSQPSTSHDTFPIISHVPSAFSMFGHNAYSAAAAAAAAGRPLGTEFGGLGSLVSESLNSPLRSPTAISTHSPISPSTGGSPWWQQSHGLGALGHDYYSHSLGLSTAFGHGTSADKEASVAGFDALFKNQKTKSSTSGTGAVRRGTGRRGRPRKTDRPNPLRVPLVNPAPTIIPMPGHHPAPLTVPKEAVSVIKEVPKLSIKVSTPSPSLSSPRRSSKSPSPRTSLPSTSSPTLSPKKKKSSSSVAKDSTSKPGSSDSSDNGLTSGDSDSNMSEVSSGDSGSDSDQYSDEKEMAEIMQAKKELEARQKLLLQQQQSIREKQQSSLSRKQKAGILSPKEGSRGYSTDEQRTEKKHQHRHGDHHHHHHRKSGQEVSTSESLTNDLKISTSSIPSLTSLTTTTTSSPDGTDHCTTNPMQEAYERKQLKDTVPTEKELHEQLLREQEQKRRAEQLTLQFEQQIKEQQQHLRMQKRAQAEREKHLMAEKARLERGQTSAGGGRERKLKPGRPRKENREQTGSGRGGKMRGRPRSDKRQKMARNLQLQVNGTQATVTSAESGAPSVDISTAPSVSSKTNAKLPDAEKGEAESSGDKEGAEHSDSVGDITGASDDCQDVSSDSDSALESEDDDDDDDSEKNQFENSEDTDTSAMARDSESSPMPMNILLKRKADQDSAMFAAYMPVQRKRLRVTDERAVRRPLSRGWRRQVIIRQLGPGDRVKGDVLYYGPCGKKLRTYPEVMRYIQRRGIVDVGREHFSFSAKIRIGEFLNPKPDSENVGGIIFEKLTENELQQRINILMGRKPRPGRPAKNMERKRIAQELARRAAEVKHRKKIEHQDMVRRIQEAKMRRKLERQQQAHLAREARRQQAIQAAEEKRRAKEHRLFLKQQQKRSRMEQLRMEREMRAHQMVEMQASTEQSLFQDRKKRKQAESQSKMMDAFKRAKEREMRRQHAVLLKHQERERRKHMLIMERERRKQHMMLVRALEARKKQEEKERQKNEKKVEKRAKKDRKMQHRMLEMQMAKELKKPVEDMKLGHESKPLPNLERLAGLKLPGQAFADCLMTLEFLHTFCDALSLDKEEDIPTMTTLQAGLLNETEYIGEVIALAIQLLALALEDPGIPDNHPEKSPWGQSVEDIDITEDNLSEMLRYYIIGVNGQDDEISKLMSTVPFKSLSAVQKASVFAFLVNQLVCSRPVIQQIEGGIDKVTNLRRDKWIVEGKMRKLRTLRAKFDKATPKQELGTSTPTLNGTPEKQSKKVNNDDDDDDDKDDDDDDMSGGEDGGVGGANEDDGGLDEEVEVESATDGLEEIEKKMEKLSKQHGQFRHKIFDASHSLRAIAFGQDRYRRRYWVLPHAGGLLVEGLESAEPNMLTVDKIAKKVETETPEESKTEVGEETVKMEKQEKEEEAKGEDEDKKEKEDEQKEDEETKEIPMDTSCSAPTQETTESEIENLPIEDRTLLSSLSNSQEEEKDEKEEKEEKEMEMEVSQPQLENSLKESETAMDKRTETIPQVNGEVDVNGPMEQDTRETLYMEVPLNLSKVDKSREDSNQQTETSCESTVKKESTASKVETPTSTASPKVAASESTESGNQDSPTKKNSPKLGYLSIDSMLQRPDRPVSSSSTNPYPPITSSSVPPPSIPLDSKPNGAMGSWFSILPRMPCDDTSLLTIPVKQEEEKPGTNDAFTDQFKQTAQAVPAFGLTPYGIYQVPFPLMHVGGMNTFMGAYSFPGVAPIPLQTLQMNQMDQSPSVNPLLPLTNTIKVKTEQEEEDEDEEADLKAIANMQALLDQMEKAQVEPISEDLQQGWWQICDPNMLRLVTRSLHMRGIRERMLQKSFQKYNDFSLKVCSKGIKNDILIESKDKKATYPDNNSIPRIPPPTYEEKEGWLQEVTFTANRGIVEAVEAMEERVFSASMQVKGWVLPEKVSIDPNLESWQTAESSGVDPISIAIKRLLALEKSVERRYLKPPLSKTENAIKLACQGQPDSEGAVSRSRSSAAAVIEDSSFPKAEEEPSKGLVRWRRTVENATSASRLHMCLSVLEKCIAWDKSIMKVFCQLCRKGDNEALLLLCDGCDKGFHTYCIKPKMTQIPEGDWYCTVCISKATGEPGTCTECQKTGKLLKCEQCPRAYHLNCLEPVLSKFPRGKWFCPPCQKIKRKASKSRNHKRKSKDKKDKGHHSGHHSGRSTPADTPSSPAVSVDKEAQKEEKAAKKKEMAPCKSVMTELEKDENSWPFLVPVNTKQFPSYRKIIKKPMDFSTIRARLHAGHYHQREEFAADVRVVFDNCETFNEDDSDVGRAGHQMRAFFESRWTELLQEHST